jgi:Domain of unknown function (DUF4263)
LSRLEYWKRQNRHYAIGIPGADENPAFSEMLRNGKQRSDSERLPPLHAKIGGSRELILQIVDGTIHFHLIFPFLDPVYLDLSYYPSFEVSGLDTDDDVKEILAIALACEVPVYPEDEQAAIELGRLHEDLIVSGFRTGNQIVKFVGKRGITVGADLPLDEYLPTESISPADVYVALARQKAVDAENERAARVIGGLKTGIEQLRKALDAETRNESELQAALTSFPGLFGLEYARVIAKYQLGKEYVTDYALERHSGLVDLVELEASTYLLYTKKGDPTKELTHAEQQVLDWLDWLDTVGTYAQINLPGLLGPTAYVVIGTSREMSNADKDRLRRRNLMWHGKMVILTYEDLLHRADGILRILTEKSTMIED